jgi:choline dehydrogenase-like flavoprotein
MQDPIVVVGSGATGVHFAETALGMGRRVVMLDVGYPKPDVAMPEASLNQLKLELDDPVRYFLGEKFESLVLPSDDSEYYGFPPSKAYVFKSLPGYRVDSRGFSPLLSFATGGLAQAWTGGSYPFSDGELEAWPFGWAELEPFYVEVAERIGISGKNDDLTQFLPMHTGVLDALELSEHSQRLLSAYENKRKKLNALGFYLGRSRIATLSRDHRGRKACSYLGRCLWGCPSQSLYTPSITLEHLKRQPDFEYVRGVRVDHFSYDDANRVTKLSATTLDGGLNYEREVGTLVLAAGALPSAKILLKSLDRAGVKLELKGLMDNRQVMMPFVNLKQIGRPFDDRSYQYHELAIGTPGERPIDYVHGLVTTLKTALIHPVVQTLPVNMRTALALFRNIHSALGLVNINFGDYRRDENRLAIERDGDDARLLVHYAPEAGEPARMGPMLKRYRSFLWQLGCVAPPSMTRSRPMGASVHYAGTLPMLKDGGDFTSTPGGRCRPFENLLLADGSTFPELPAKNLTFTLMANATRIARGALAR